jgi:DNA end-binding protein Ku
MPKCIVCATISFGLVAIPVKVFTAASSEQISFNTISPKGNRVEQQYVDKVTGDVVEREECSKGYEHTKGMFALFTAEELKSLEAKRSQVMEIKEFVPLDTVDLLQVEKSYYLGPDKGGDKGYRLLSKVLEKTGQVAVATYSARGKEQLILIRPYEEGLVLHQMFYENEVRDFAEVLDTCAEYEPSGAEVALAERLIQQLATPTFVPGKYKDGYAERVKAAVDEKLTGQKVVPVGDTTGGGPLMDIFDALRQSLAASTDVKPAAKKATAKTKIQGSPKSKATHA